MNSIGAVIEIENEIVVQDPARVVQLIRMGTVIRMVPHDCFTHTGVVVVGIWVEVVGLGMVAVGVELIVRVSVHIGKLGMGLDESCDGDEVGKGIWHWVLKIKFGPIGEGIGTVGEWFVATLA